MSKLALLTFGTEQYRIGSWRGQRTTGYVAPLSPPDQLTRAGLEQVLRRLVHRGYHDVLTAALTEPRTAMAPVVENIERIRAGQPAHHLVDFGAGY